MADALVRMRANRARRVAAMLPTGRTCAGCDLCCTAPGIRELGKPPGVPCQQLRGDPGASCGVYAHRPKVCIDFHCLWRMADFVLPEWLQPARCGFLLAFNNPQVWPTVVTVHVDPARPDAWRTPWAQTVFATLAERWNCLVAIGQVPLTTFIFCPDSSRIDVRDHPALMSVEKGTVAAPGFVFGPDRRPLMERFRETRFSWKLAPPPM
jgi:hypothetical protein